MVRGPKKFQDCFQEKRSRFGGLDKILQSWIMVGNIANRPDELNEFWFDVLPGESVM